MKFHDDVQQQACPNTGFDVEKLFALKLVVMKYPFRSVSYMLSSKPEMFGVSYILQAHTSIHYLFNTPGYTAFKSIFMLLLNRQGTNFLTDHQAFHSLFFHFDNLECDKADKGS